MRENTQSNMYLGLHNQTEKYWFQMTISWADMNRQDWAFQGQRKGEFWYLRSNINRTRVTVLDIWIKGFYAQNKTDADTAWIWEQTENFESKSSAVTCRIVGCTSKRKRVGSGKLIVNILRAVCYLLLVTGSLFADPNFSKSANIPQMCNTKMTQDSLQPRLAVPCRHSQLVLGNQWARCNCNTANCL